MVRTWMPKIQVNEQALIINNHDDVVHWIDNLVSIKQNLMGHIIPRFMDLNECATNESNATLKI
jgi:hypothetical protein